MLYICLICMNQDHLQEYPQFLLQPTKYVCLAKLFHIVLLLNPCSFEVTVPGLSLLDGHLAGYNILYKIKSSLFSKFVDVVGCFFQLTLCLDIVKAFLISKLYFRTFEKQSNHYLFANDFRKGTCLIY